MVYVYHLLWILASFGHCW